MVKVLLLRMRSVDTFIFHEQPLTPNYGCMGAGVYCSRHQARGRNAGHTMVPGEQKSFKVQLHPQTYCYESNVLITKSETIRC